MNPSTKGSNKFDSTRLILVPAANNSIAARPSAASRQSKPSLNSHGTIMSRIGCSSSTKRTRGRSGLGRAFARVPVSVLTELINPLNLSSCCQMDRASSQGSIDLPSFIAPAAPAAQASPDAVGRSPP